MKLSNQNNYIFNKLKGYTKFCFWIFVGDEDGRWWEDKVQGLGEKGRNHKGDDFQGHVVTWRRSWYYLARPHPTICNIVV
jgi:hypothetical protein